MTVCGSWSLEQPTHYGARAITLWCRSWTCSDCAPFRIGALKRMATNGQPTTFLTLTVNAARGQSPEARAQELSDALKILIKRARRKFTKSPIEYLAVFEETKKGEPHLHILMRAPFIPQRWLSETMDELIAAPIVDIRKVGAAKNAARYVAKYVGKGPKPFAALKRYWASRGYDLTEPDPATREKGQGTHWHVVREPLWRLIQTWQVFGYEPQWVSESEVVALNTHRRRTSMADVANFFRAKAAEQRH